MKLRKMPEEKRFHAVNLSKRAGRYEDRCPTFVRDREGRCWVTWFSFRDGADEILARGWDEKELSPIYTISDSGGISYRPVIASETSDAVWIFWSAFREGVWNVFGRRYADERWDEAIQLTFGEETDYLPCAVTDAQGRVWVAWVSVREGHHRIMVRSWDGRHWSEPMELSEGLKHSFRPALSAGTDGAVWIAWDSYTDGNYDVYARRCVNEAWSPAMRVSQRDAWEFKPSITVDRGGAWLVWLSSTDVRNRDDVIDQWPTIRCAHYDGQRWGIQDDVAHLCHGLLPKTSVWGYLGRRRHPMIQADDRGGVWVLWERKDRHDGATGRSVGVLCGRYFDGADWSEPVELHRGKHHYEIASGPNGLDGGRLWLTGYEAFGADDGDLWIGRLEIGSPREFSPLRDESWQGWKPIRLRNSMFREPHRRSVTADGETYTLFWGDLHCHSVLSADAEGEQDELTFYARDKAGLDFFAITDNDFYQRTLTASEWALTRTHAAHANEPGRFVVFSGYEWTHRASEDAPPNHRSIYYLTDDRPIHRCTDPDMQGDVARLEAYLREEQALWHPHHERWEILEAEGVANVEVCSGWLISIERNDTSLHEHLRRGHRFGFVGGSDSHRRGPGLGGALVAVYAKTLTRKAIFDALKHRRCYATGGARIWVDFRIDDRMMGSELTVYRPPHITLHTVGTTPIQRVDLIRNGQIIHSVFGDDLELRFEYDDESLPEETSYYYVCVQQEGTTVSYPSNVAPARGNSAWSSPIWVTL